MTSPTMASPVSGVRGARTSTWCLYRRSLLGDLARVAAHTATAAVRALTGEADLAVGIVASIQTHGSLDNCWPTGTPTSI